ncbi:RNA polymerase factor sigma-54 [Sulfurifustis variabilis]|uniref:RNA polymerase sigma-54 factor n=1 Tax=Sulfurifustis variabilis TaxID=1675686 RepID=A0A1B4V3V6_9GAMM|nr:RNA polymerase factor sigma-54 [Sulfurifustis variabilis]BAU47202.1 RNA polymerase factor sigma-54 [Sulfurifustis variabilis]
MKQSLDLRLGQHLTITPQLQQAIRLLQLSTVELQQEIQEALETNPLLEEGEESENRDANGEGEAGESETEYEAEASEPADLDMEQADLGETSAESDWDEAFDLPLASGSRNEGDERPDIDARNSRPQTLREHLLWQMHMTSFSVTDRRVAEALIDAINEDGYLTCKLEEVQQILAKESPPTQAELDEIEAVLHQVQNFDPIGVGARDLAECLLLQLKALDPETPYLREALRLATPEHLALLGGRDYNQLRRNLKVTPETLHHAVQLIQRLNPRPGGTVQSVAANYIVPDIIVRKIRGIWRADLNQEVAPRLRINRMYERLIHRGDGSRDNRYLQDQLQQARWFIKSLNSRNETLLKVARTIVDRQRAFFDHGPEAMKPLVLHDIAEAVSMHESTISRVTTNKYMLTPRGIYELKYFFSSHVGTADGGACSATAIRSMIKKLVENEPPTKPISDSKIAEILAGQGIHVARRTVAKYRESISIPPSNQRKSII